MILTMIKNEIHKSNNYRQFIRFEFIMLIIFGCLFLTGTFLDKTAAETFFSPDITILKLITSTGVYPIYTAPVLFSGALCQRIVYSDKSKQAKLLLCIFLIIAALFVGFCGGKSFSGRNNLGGLFPSFIRNVPVIIILSVIFEYPMFWVGYCFAKKSDDKLLARRITVLFIVLLTAYVSMQVLKNSFDRPRYRTVSLGYDGISFVPWYTPFTDAEGMAAAYALDADEFRSFPSGHSLFSILSVCIFPSLAWLFPRLKVKQMKLFYTGSFFGLIIMATRIILGAHYLSDVSAGAFIGTLFSLAFAAIQLHISEKPRKA